MRKNLLLVVVILLVVFAIIYAKQQQPAVVPIEEPTVTEEVVTEGYVPATERSTVVELEILDAQYAEFDQYAFMLPEEWTSAGTEQVDELTEVAKFGVPDDQYEVFIKMELKAVTGAEVIGEPVLDLTEKGVKFYQEACGGPSFNCYYIVEGNQMYFVTFDVESNETVAENLDGVWSPSTQVTNEDLLNMLGTVLTK